MEYLIFIDESRHIENDGYKYMVIGGLWVSIDSYEQIKKDIKAIKLKHNIKGEIKWTHISPSSLNFYLEIIEYFFKHDDLYYRCVTVNKNKLDHPKHNSNHSEFYFRVCYQLIIKKIEQWLCYRIFLDHKGENDSAKISALMNCLSKKIKDTEQQIIFDIQQIRSDQSILIQICDVLTGAVGYERNKINTSLAKIEIVESILKHTSRKNFSKNSPLSENKFNVFNMFDL
jgi:hypothetical protein